MRKMKELKASEIAEKIEGKLKGPDKVIKGIFNILKDAENGDAVIRHWIDEKGVEIVVKKGVSCLITQSPKDGAVETAEKLGLSLIAVSYTHLTLPTKA